MKKGDELGSMQEENEAMLIFIHTVKKLYVTL